MEWSDTFSVGIAKIDDQHKMLFRIVTDYRTALLEGEGEKTYGLFLQTLRTYCHAHFDFEEECMAKLFCPAAQQNEEAHRKFLAVLGEYKGYFADRGFVREDTLKLITFLERWITEHICGIDLQLRDSISL